MARKLLLYLFTAGLFIGLVSPSFAQEKMKWGTSVKTLPSYYLPALAAEERGFWKDNGLEGEWVPFDGGAPHIRAAAAGSINMGMASGAVTMTAIARGLPAVFVAELIPSEPFTIFVRGDSPYREVRDLKGKKIAVTGLGAGSHVFGRIITKAHGVEKDVRFVGAGGVPTMLAGLKAGSFEGAVEIFGTYASLKVEGIVREIASAADYLPKPWVDHIAYARKDFARSKPEVVRRTIKTMLQATDFIMKNPRWTIDRVKSYQGYSEEVGKLVYERLVYTTTGRFDRKALENVRSLFIEYGVLPEKTPAVDDLFTNEYIP